MNTECQTIFISYSHKDRKWLDLLLTHLRPYMRQGLPDIWVDTEIKPGTLWQQEIEKALAKARVAILLVSANFLASDFIATRELPLLLTRAKRDDLAIMWIAASASAYKIIEISEYQAVNDPEKPLESLKGHARNRE